MNRLIAVVTAVMSILLLSLPVLAEDKADDKLSYAKLEAGARSSRAAEDVQLDQRKSDFVRFAQAKLAEMNRNHLRSRSRMQIEKNPDGTYRALYHQIDETTMACEVNRSKSKSIPYVAVLSYREHVYAASCPTPEACQQSNFTPVAMIPNRYIFSYNKGTWQ